MSLHSASLPAASPSTLPARLVTVLAYATVAKSHGIAGNGARGFVRRGLGALRCHTAWGTVLVALLCLASGVASATSTSTAVNFGSVNVGTTTAATTDLARAKRIP